MAEEIKGKHWTLFERLAHATNNASVFIQRTAVSASEVLSDADLRRKAGSKIVDGARAGVKGLQGGLQGLDLVARNLVLNVGGGLQSGRRGVQGVLERVVMRLEQQRLLRALAVEKDMPVDVQIGFRVYEAVSQEIRSRYWLVLVSNPALGKPFQELGRFPDVGDYDPDLRHQDSIEKAAGSPPGAASPPLESDPSVFITKPKPRTDCNQAATSTCDPENAERPTCTTLSEPRAVNSAEESSPDDDSQIPDISDSQPLLSSSCAGPRQSGSSAASPRHPMLRGGEGLDDARLAVDGVTGAPASPDLATSLTSAISGIRLHNSARKAQRNGTDDDASFSDAEECASLLGGARGGGDDGWEVVDKLDPLVESSFVGPATLTHPSRQSVPRSGQSTAAEGSVADSEAAQTPHQSMSAADKVERLRQKHQAQAQAAKRLHDATETLKTAMIAVDWPVTEIPQTGNGSRYEVLLQMTVGQEDVEEIIRRDIHRTFPEHPHFLLGQGQESLYNVLKAYSVTDLVVGYCQGMAFVAGILLMYMPEQVAFKVFCALMSPTGPNIRRFYLPGLDDLKLEMAKFEWLLERHHPKLFQHLQTNGVPCVLYASQWLLTIFACPFPVDFTARIIDIMLMEQSDHIVMQTAMAIMAECESSLLNFNDFEDIITYLKTEPCEWANDKLHGLINAAYISSVSDSEIQLASEVVTMERVERMMAKPAGRPSKEQIPVMAKSPSLTPEHSVADVLAGDEGSSRSRSARRSMVDMDNDMGLIALVMEQEIENLRWAGPSKEHSLIDAEVV